MSDELRTVKNGICDLPENGRDIDVSWIMEEVEKAREKFSSYNWISFYVSPGLWFFGGGQLVGIREMTKKELEEDDAKIKHESEKADRRKQYEKLKEEFEVKA